MPRRVTLDWSIDQFCPGCERQMRPKSEHSDLAVYGAFGYCLRCDKRRKSGRPLLPVWDGVAPCMGCSRDMVPQRAKVPGVPVHVSEGLCDRCYRRSKRGMAFDIPDRRSESNYVPQPCPYGCGRLIKPFGVPMHKNACTGPNNAMYVTSSVELNWLGSDVHDKSPSFKNKPPQGCVYIYALLDCDSNIKYVGKTIKSLEGRLYGHYSDANRKERRHSKVGRWLNTQKSGVRIALLGTYSEDLWEVWEKYWIATLLNTGAELKNVELGGNTHKKTRK